MSADARVCTAGDWSNSEFELRRRLARRTLRSNPAERLAALLVAISSNNRYEGRDPTSVPDSLTCGFVADLLGVNVSTLAQVLVALERKGLVAATPSAGLKLLDIAGLEALAAPQCEALAHAA